jgi:hypothetical protein
MEVDAEVEMDVVHRDQFRLALGNAGQQIHFRDARDFDHRGRDFASSPRRVSASGEPATTSTGLAGQVGELLRPRTSFMADDPLA